MSFGVKSLEDRMRLTDEEEEIRAGGRGPAARAAIEHQLAVGDFFGAQRLVPITNAHVMGDWEVMGEGGYRYLQDVVAAGGRVAVPTTRNATPVDVRYAERLRQEPALVAGEARVTTLLRELGVTSVDTCIGYQSLYQPTLGEHVAWGDTGAAIYANAVFGARTNFESGPAALAAALTGRTPEYGFHLEANRRPTVRCRIDFALGDLSDWGALGAVVGSSVSGYETVPLLDCVEPPSSPDAIKHLGAALASYGSLGMFHLAGSTPEAASVDESAIDAEVVITRDQLDAVYDAVGTAGDPVDLVVFTAPQLSLFELRRLAGLLDGQRLADDVTLIVTTNAMTRSAADDAGYLGSIEETGALVLQGTCWYIMAPAEMAEAFSWKRLVSNSAKLVNIVKAHGYEAILRTTDACVDAAISGKVPAR
jgi:predicted aconitase